MNRTLLSALLMMSAAIGGAQQLTPEQMKAAIDYGSKFKAVDSYLEKGVQVWQGPIEVASGMGRSSTILNVTLFGNWDYAAMTAAAAKQQMRQQPTESPITGNLHMIVSAHALGALRSASIGKKYGETRAHVVLQTDDEIIQPIEKEMISRSETAIFFPTSEVRLLVDFDVPDPARLIGKNLKVVIIDGGGDKHAKEFTLRDVFTPPASIKKRPSIFTRPRESWKK